MAGTVSPANPNVAWRALRLHTPNKQDRDAGKLSRTCSARLTPSRFGIRTSVTSRSKLPFCSCIARRVSTPLLPRRRYSHSLEGSPSCNPGERVRHQRAERAMEMPLVRCLNQPFGLDYLQRLLDSQIHIKAAHLRRMRGQPVLPRKAFRRTRQRLRNLFKVIHKDPITPQAGFSR